MTAPIRPLRYPIRVIFGDTDQLGVVYYANFLRFFEASRAALLRHFGRSNRDLEAWGVAFPVAEAHCRYLRPAHYEDLIDIVVDVSEVRSASLRFDYRVERDGELLAEGWTRHACIDTGRNRPRRLPAELVADLST